MRRLSTSFAVCASLALLFFASNTTSYAESFDGTVRTAASEEQEKSTDLAYMDLTLTTTDSVGGQITVDEAFSLYLRSGATDGWDPYDASKMLPRGDQWAIIAFKGKKNGTETLKAQESRPYEDSVQVVDVELVQKNMPAATYTITVDRWYSVPSNWSLRLHSSAMDTSFVITGKSDTVTFELGASSSTSSSSKTRTRGSKSTTDTSHVSLAGEVGPEATTLPVELAAFDATVSEQTAILRWETASETNNSGFAIQHRPKRSTNQESGWTRLGFVDGEGTTDQPQRYQFNTSTLTTGTHLFRLKQIDRDGTAHLSESVKIILRPNGAMELSTAPNPFTSRLTVALTARSRQSAQIQLVDMLGRVVKQVGPIELRANTRTRRQFDARRLASGSYILRVQGDTFTASSRVVHVQ